MSEYVDYQLVGILAGLSILFLSGGLALRVERARWETRLRDFLGLPQGPTEPLITPSRRGDAPDGRHPILRLAKIGAAPHELAQAGLSMSPRRFLVMQVVSAALGCALVRLAALRFGFDPAIVPASLAIGAVGGVWLPRFVLRILRGRRLRRFEKQFPSAIDAVANSLEAGLSLPQSVELVGRDMPTPLGPEFSRVFRELGLGLSLGEALRGLADRVPLSDVELFVTAVEIQYRIGGNQSEILHGIAHTVRERLRIKGEIQVLTAQQRLSAWVVSALPLAITGALKFMNPSYVDRLTEPGMMRIFVIVAILGIISGFYVLMRIADIEV
jgi:tight adherence protein B